MLGQGGLGGIEARQHRRGIFSNRSGQCACILGIVGRLRVAIHIGHERRIALAGQPAGFIADVLGDAPPLVHDDDAGSFRGAGIVVDDEALHDGVAVLVGDRFLLDRGARAEPHPHHSERKTRTNCPTE